MRSRRILRVVLTVATLALLPSTSSAHLAKQHVRGCAPINSTVLAADRDIQIYDKRPPSGFPSLGIFGCTRRGGHVFRLDKSDTCHCRIETEPLWASVAVAGPVVAYVENRNSAFYGSRQISVRSLNTGRILHSFDTGELVSSLVVKSDGSVAWAISDDPNLPLSTVQATYSIYVLDRNGSRILADELAQPTPSLHLAGSNLTWTQEGHTMSATID